MLLLHAVLPEEDWWELPGGGIEPDEAPEQAALRELVEEAGIVADRLDAHLGTVDTEFWFDGRRYHQRECVFLLSPGRVSVRLGEPDPPPFPHHLEYRWWRAEELDATDALVHPPQLAELLRAARGDR